jgi:hypothetical protein
MSPRGATSAEPSASAAAPRGGPFDRPADVVAGGLERVELLSAAEDGDGDAAVPVVPEIVLVEVDAVVLCLELQLDRVGLAVEMHLDEASALVRVDPSSHVLRKGAAGGRKRDHRRGEQRCARSRSSHDGVPPSNEGCECRSNQA